MKKTIQSGFFALFMLSLIGACNQPNKVEPPKTDRIIPVITSLDARSVEFAWEPLPDGQTMKVSWKSRLGKKSGSVIAKGNKIVIAPDANGEALQFTFVPMKGEQELEGYQAESAVVMSNSTSSIAANDTVGTVDIIIQKVIPAKEFSAAWCEATFGACSMLQDCYGSWFRINRSSAEEVYRVTIEGFNRANVVSSVRFFVKVNAAGQAEYVTNGQLGCLSLNPAHLTAAGRFTIYDNGDFAFSMNTTESTTVSGKGILIQPLKNIKTVLVEKMGGCTEARM